MNRIKELRKQNNWLQSDLAVRLNTKAQTVSRYELGDRGLDVETIGKLCEIFLHPISFSSQIFDSVHFVDLHKRPW